MNPVRYFNHFLIFDGSKMVYNVYFYYGLTNNI